MQQLKKQLNNWRKKLKNKPDNKLLMKAAIYSNTLLIGHVDLQAGDETMGHVYGEFVPTSGYYEYIQNMYGNFGQPINLTTMNGIL